MHGIRIGLVERDGLQRGPKRFQDFGNLGDSDENALQMIAESSVLIGRDEHERAKAHRSLAELFEGPPCEKWLSGDEEVDRFDIGVSYGVPVSFAEVHALL